MTRIREEEEVDDVPHCRILSSDKTEWRLISATLLFRADQLWFMTRIREEEEEWTAVVVWCNFFKFQLHDTA